MDEDTNNAGNKKTIFKNADPRKRKIASIVGFSLLLVFYIATELGSKVTSTSTEIFMIGKKPLPLSALAGVFSSISTIILICWTVFYRKKGFRISMIFLSLRILRLSTTLINFNPAILPAFFITIATITANLIIYTQNEKILKYKDWHRKEVEDFTKEIIGAFANCIDGKDSYTNGHSLRVAKYTRLIAKKLGEPDETVDKFYNIALLHDIGKIGIPDAILNKPGKLTPEEFEVIKSHPQRGYEILKDVKIQEDISAGAHYHHERFDAKGYPDQLGGNDIPWVARIISVADAFDAMGSTRPYRQRLPVDFVVQEIENGSGTQFDPTVVKAFLELYKEGAFTDVKEPGV